MAQHDYVIDNSTGANVRADINSALQAIVTNNSGSSAPSSTFPFMLFADSSAGTMKIRNAADNAFIELFQLDGTFTLEDGSASTPALAFRDDLNTGIFSGGSDEFNISTGGTERIVINSNGFVGIGTATPTDTAGSGHCVDIKGGSSGTAIYLRDSSNNTGQIDFSNSNMTIRTRQATPILFNVNNSERMRIDSSGKVGIGTTSPSAVLHCRTETAKTNEVEHMIRLTHTSSGTTTTGFGTGIRFQGERNNGAVQTIGDINFEADVNSGSNISAALVFKPALSGSPTERMRIDSSGNVGIGTASPSFKLTVSSDENNLFLKQNTGDHGYILDVNQGDGTLAFNRRVSGSDTERMRIDSSGNVGIGVTSVSAKLHADNGGSGNVGFLKHSQSGIAVTLVLQNNRATSSTAGEQISFLDETGTQRGKITNNTSSTTYSTSSDYRLKENEVEISDGVERVKQLKPYKFKWKHLPNKTVDGFFAHEVQNIVEDCVDGTKDKVVTEEDHNKGDYLDKEIGTEIHQMMDHSKLVPLLTAAIKSIITRVEALETA